MAVDDVGSVVERFRGAFRVPPGKRSCGECTECCRVRAVDAGGVLATKKPAWTPCTHCTGTACAVYENRPPLCRAYKCLWLLGLGPDDARPDRSNLLVDLAINGTTPETEYLSLSVTACREALPPDAELPPWVAEIVDTVLPWEELVVDLAPDPNLNSEMIVPNVLRERVLADPRIRDRDQSKDPR